MSGLPCDDELWRIEPKLSEQRIHTHFFERDRCGLARSEDIARPAPP
jgi:hypothetical protein